MGAGGIADTARPRGPKYTWAAILGFRSLAAEKDIPNLSISCALDFSHLGVYLTERDPSVHLGHFLTKTSSLYGREDKTRDTILTTDE
jgi:hypothetical protein